MFGRNRRERVERAQRDRRANGRFVTLLAVVGGVVVVLLFLKSNLINLPDWFSGGSSDPVPHGTVTYKGQKALAASDTFLVDIGDGEATVSVKAKQDWDTPGGIFSGDFQFTNGTASVADPKDRGNPAALKVKVDYCSDGLVTTFTPVNPDANGPDKRIRFEMGHLYVCATTLEHTRLNDAAFKQDDTPNIFQGEFVTFVARAVEWTAAAAACPTEELAKFQTDAFLRHTRQQLADQFGMPVTAVEVVKGTPGHSAPQMQRSLRRRLESYANARDPEHPSKQYKALDIQYLSTDKEAVKYACYRDPGSHSLKDIDTVTPPRTPTTTSGN
jgi:hypothetical protein